MKTLYVHIGTPKTATSAIQNFCCENREVLESRGYCYPEFPYTYPRLSRARNGLFLEAQIRDENGERRIDEEKRILREGLDTVRGLFDEYENVILSDEVLWRATNRRRAELWEELREEGGAGGFQVKILVYLRRQDEYVSSWWNQVIKKRRIPLTMTWQEYREKMTHTLQPDYYRKLSRIAEILGKESIIVRRFERARFYGGTVESDFLHAIGLEPSDAFVRKEFPINLSLAGNTHEIKRILNTLPDITEEESIFYSNALRNYSALSGSDYPSSVLSAEERAEFMAPYLEGNRRIAEEFLGEKDSLLFDMSFPDTAKWEKDNPHMLDDIIRFVGMSERGLMNRISLEEKKAGYLDEKTRKLEKKSRDLEKKSRDLEEKTRILKSGLQEMKKQARILQKENEALAARQDELVDKLKHPFQTVLGKMKKR